MSEVLSMKYANLDNEELAKVIDGYSPGYEAKLTGAKAIFDILVLILCEMRLTRQKNEELTAALDNFFKPEV